jgi:hypothetical protein
MPEDPLPTADTAYQWLCTRGTQFDEDFVARNTFPLAGLGYRHLRDGWTTIAANRKVLAATGRIYAKDIILRRALAEHGARTAEMDDARRLVWQYVASDGLVWGFSGFATPGYSYELEAKGIIALHDHLARIGNKPVLVTDGGGGAGILGLSGVLAAQQGIPTLGLTPYQGVARMAPRDHTIVWGQTYADREVLVGLLPDVLVCVGGGDGACRECQVALRHNGVVLLLALRDYGPLSLPATYAEFPGMQHAAKEGRLIVCRTLADIPASVDAALAAIKVFGPFSQLSRLDELTRLVSS